MEEIRRDSFKILVVDDTPELLDLTVKLLKKADFMVITAGTGEECLAKAAVEDPDIILLDVILPDINGREICRQIKSDSDATSPFIILLSSYDIEAEMISEGLNYGADGYIIRPVSGKELIARIDAAIRIIWSEKALRRSLDEVSRINNLYLDRELKMIDLKKEVNKLLAERGDKPKYRVFENGKEG